MGGEEKGSAGQGDGKVVPDEGFEGGEGRLGDGGGEDEEEAPGEVGLEGIVGPVESVPQLPPLIASAFKEGRRGEGTDLKA